MASTEVMIGGVRAPAFLLSYVSTLLQQEENIVCIRKWIRKN
jgi:hypothetical protein